MTWFYRIFFMIFFLIQNLMLILILIQFNSIFNLIFSWEFLHFVFLQLGARRGTFLFFVWIKT